MAKTIIREARHCVIGFLLSNIEMNTRRNSLLKSKPFESNIGTSRGDKGSPVLITIYLELAFKMCETLSTYNSTGEFE